MSEEVVIVSGVRTAIGKFGRGFREVPAQRLGAIAIKEAVNRARLQLQDVEEVIMGNVISAGLGQNPARQAAIHAGIPPETGSFTVNKVCGSGLKAIMLGARILVTLLYALKDRGPKRGLATLCLGGGNAVAMIVERQDD